MSSEEIDYSYLLDEDDGAPWPMSDEMEVQMEANMRIAIKAGRKGCTLPANWVFSRPWIASRWAAIALANGDAGMMAGIEYSVRQKCEWIAKKRANSMETDNESKSV